MTGGGGVTELTSVGNMVDDAPMIVTIADRVRVLVGCGNFSASFHLTFLTKRQ